MAIRITCPHCKACYPIDESLRGKRIACQECLKPLAIPAAKVAPPRQAGDAAVSAARSRPVPPRQPVVQAPRPQVAKKQSGIPLVWLIGGGLAVFGVLFIVVAAVGAVILFVPGGILASKDKSTQVVQDTGKDKPAETATKPDRNAELKTPPNTDAKPAPKKDDPKPFPQGDTKSTPKAPPKKSTEKAKQPPPDQKPVKKKPLPAGWQEFTDRDIGFSVAMPAGTVPAAEGPANAQLKGFKLEDKLAGRLFWAAYQELPPDEASLPPDIQLNSAKQGLEAGSNIKVTSETKITLGKYPGREFVQVVQGPGGKVSVFTRIYVVEDGIFFLVAVSAGLTRTSPEYQAFFTSFQLSKK